MLTPREPGGAIFPEVGFPPGHVHNSRHFRIRARAGLQGQCGIFTRPGDREARPALRYPQRPGARARRSFYLRVSRSDQSSFIHSISVSVPSVRYTAWVVK